MRIVALAALALASPLSAQALSCAVPAQIERPHYDGPDAKTPRRVLPTASYTLAITWSPQFCKGGEANAFQCGSGNRFGFTLHGLWPDGAGRDWPQYCKPVELISDATIRANLCATPSPQLLQHEYAKHASCMTGTADDYFRRSTGLYGRLRFPDMNALSRRSGLTVGMLAAAIARANPGIAPGMMRVTTTRGGWLDEIWLCLDLKYRYRQCKANTGGAKPNTRLKIWRDER
ncbi:MAG: ribonuclease T [Sphingomonadales bacterium]